MAQNYDKFSRRGLARHTKVDANALTDLAGCKMIRVPWGAFTQNSTVKTSAGPLGFPGKIVAVYASAATLPAGGTLGDALVAYDASANAEIVITDTGNPEALTAREGATRTLAATNVALAAEDTLEAHTIASDDSVGTAQIGGAYLVWVRPLDESDPAFTVVG